MHLKAEIDSHQVKKNKSRRTSAANAENTMLDFMKADSSIDDRITSIETTLENIRNEFDDEMQIVQSLSHALQEQQNVLQSLYSSGKGKARRSTKVSQRNLIKKFSRNQISPFMKI